LGVILWCPSHYQILLICDIRNFYHREVLISQISSLPLLCGK
jgi:hypothetical protein